MSKRIFRCLVFLLPFCVAFSAILPDVIEYHVSARSLTVRQIDAWWENYRENDELRAELNSVRVRLLGEIVSLDAIRTADKLLDGKLQLSGLPPVKINLPFSSEDLNTVPSTLQLKMASLLIADIFLEAYRASLNDEYLTHSIAYTEGFLRYEDRLWLPEGFMWNDHAVAARTLFLTRLVDAAMDSGIVDPESIAHLVGGIDRSVRLLAKPSQYTYRTNHGIIQNVAIMHVAAFNEEIPAIKEHIDSIRQRTTEQMKFFISANGAVVEHSAGYQEFGVQLFSYMIRYYELRGDAVPEGWSEKYGLALKFLAHLSRSDGTIPRYGDTIGFLKSNIEASRSSSVLLNEDIGYWSTWINDDTHLFVPWAKLVGNAHKHADEMAVFFWSGGQEWWTGTGYWPYGHPGQIASFGWAGSNAPHTIDEAQDSQRDSRVVSSLSNDHVRLLHLRRKRSDGYTIDRIIFEDVDGYWFVIDAPFGTVQSDTLSHWQTMNAVHVRPNDTGTIFQLRSAEIAKGIDVSVVSGPGSSSELTFGGPDSESGWLALNRREIVPTSVISTKTPPDSWTVLSWAESEAVASYVTADDVIWGSSQNWTIRYSIRGSSRQVGYDSNTLIFSDQGQAPYTWSLNKGSATLPILDRTEAQYRKLQQIYTRYRDLLDYRIRAWLILTGLSVLNALIGLALFARAKRSVATTLMSASLVIWVGLGVWMHTVYFI